MMMVVITRFLLFVCIIASTYGQPGRGLRPEEFLHMARHGAILTYDIDISKCDVKLPQTLPAYSYGDVMNDVYIEFGDEEHWRLYTTEERPVNTSRFQTENGGWRVTEAEFIPSSPEDGNALITLTDIEQGAEGKVLASGSIACNISSGGFTVNAQRMGDREVERQMEVLMAFRRGESLTFSVDLSACSRQGKRPPRAGAQFPLAANGSEIWTGRISGYRVPGKIEQPALEFTSLLMGPKEREVFNVRLQGENQVEVKSYALSRPTHEPTPVVMYNCTLGTSGSFHVYHM